MISSKSTKNWSDIRRRTSGIERLSRVLLPPGICEVIIGVWGEEGMDEKNFLKKLIHFCDQYM